MECEKTTSDHWEEEISSMNIAFIQEEELVWAEKNNATRERERKNMYRYKDINREREHHWIKEYAVREDE